MSRARLHGMTATPGHSAHVGILGVAGLLAALVGACSPAPSPSPTTPGPSATAASTPPGSTSPSSPTGAQQPCRADELAMELGRWEGAAGGRFALVVVRTEGPTCTLTGSPAVAIVDRAGTIIIDSTTEPDGGPHVTPGDPVVTVGPDRGATIAIGTSNWCDPPPQVPIGVLITFADESSRGFTPAQGTPDDLPPCNDPGSPARVFVQFPWQPEA
jgi:hypothetical protein